MNDHFSQTCLLLIVGLLAVIAFKPRKNTDAPKSRHHPDLCLGRAAG